MSHLGISYPSPSAIELHFLFSLIWWFTLLKNSNQKPYICPLCSEGWFNLAAYYLLIPIWSPNFGWNYFHMLMLFCLIESACIALSWILCVFLLPLLSSYFSLYFFSVLVSLSFPYLRQVQCWSFHFESTIMKKLHFPIPHQSNPLFHLLQKYLEQKIVKPGYIIIPKIYIL